MTGEFVIYRLQQDQQFSAAGEKFELKYIMQAVKDKKTWISSKAHRRS